MVYSTEDNVASRIFKASNFWESNAWGAVVAGIGGGLLMSVVGAIVIFQSEDPSGRMAGALLIVTVAATLAAMFPGNLVAARPIAVELEEGKGLRLCAPLKRLYIPIEEIQDVRSTMSSFLQTGFLVQLNKRHGLLKSFVIDWFLGDDGRELARILQREINKR